VRGSGRRPVRAGIALAGLALTVAGCSSALPLGPTPAPAPTPHHLSSPIVLQTMLSKQPGPAGGCPSGYTTLTGPGLDYAGASGTCYRKTGKPVTITVAGITLHEQRPPGSQNQPVVYAVNVTLPAAGTAALTAITTTSYDSRDPIAIIVAGEIWGIPYTQQPFTQGQFEIAAQSKNQALQLEHTLLPSALSCRGSSTFAM
jgi:hypothetical protein